MTAARIPAPRGQRHSRTTPGWEWAARCRAPRPDGLDFTELTTEVLAFVDLFPGSPVAYRFDGPGGQVERADAAADLASARAECAACPVLAKCWKNALSTRTLPGVVAGLTETERAEATARAGVAVEALTLAVMVPRPYRWTEQWTGENGRVHSEVVDGVLWVLDLSTETAPSLQWDEITVEELAAVRVLRAWGWSREAIADRLVTVRAAQIRRCGDPARERMWALADKRPGVRIPWTVDRVAHALAVLAGSQGSDDRRAGVA